MVEHQARLKVAYEGCWLLLVTRRSGTISRSTMCLCRWASWIQIQDIFSLVVYHILKAPLSEAVYTTAPVDDLLNVMAIYPGLDLVLA